MKASRICVIVLCFCLCFAWLPENTIKVEAANTPLTDDQISAKVLDYIKALGGDVNNLDIVNVRWYWNGGIRTAQGGTGELARRVDMGDYTSILTRNACEGMRYGPDGKASSGEHNISNPKVPDHCNSNYFDGAHSGNGPTQCSGFADYMEYVIFGGVDKTVAKSKWAKIEKVSSEFKFRPGDLIRDKKEGHSFVIYETKPAIRIIECNYGSAYGNCSIRWNRKPYSRETLVDMINNKEAVLYCPPSTLRTSDGGSTTPTVSKPSAPTGLSASWSIDTEWGCDISWSPSNGATSYVVEYLDEDDNTWYTDDDYTGGTKYTSTLKYNTNYQFRVCAKNAAGTSSCSTPLVIKKKINITLNPNGGSVSPTYHSAEYNNGKGLKYKSGLTGDRGVYGGLSQLPTPVRNGYIFEGWYYNSNRITDTTPIPINDHTIVASWTPVKVSGVSLNKSSQSLTVGNTLTLSASITPSNALDKSVSWSSSNSAVASVSNGVVTAKSVGTAIITAKTTDGNKTASCTVTVTDDGNIDTPEGEYTIWDTKVPPQDATDIESRTVYRYRSKQHATTTNQTLSAPWTQEGTNNVSYGAWSSTWSKTPLYSSDVLQVEGKTFYHYFTYYSGASAPWTRYNDVKNLSNPKFAEIWVDAELPKSTLFDTVQSYGGVTYTHVNPLTGISTTYPFKRWIKVQGTTHYGLDAVQNGFMLEDDCVFTKTFYRSRPITTTRTYWKWNEWSASEDPRNWSLLTPAEYGVYDEYESATLYRYRVPEPTLDPTAEPTAEPTPDPTASPTPTPVPPSPTPVCVTPTPTPTIHPCIPVPPTEHTPVPTANPTPTPTLGCVSPVPVPETTPDPTPTTEPVLPPAEEHICELNDKGYCAECGEIVDGKAALYGRQLILNDSIGVTFYMDLTSNVDKNALVMRFTLANGKTIEKTSAEIIVKNMGGKPRYGFMCEVFATEMNQQITAQLYEGENPIGNPYVYSVKTYCDTQLQNDAILASPKTVNLIQAMMNYGAMSQTYFGNTAEGLVTTSTPAPFTTTELEGLQTNYPKKAHTQHARDQIAVRGMSLVLRTETALRAEFTMGTKAEEEKYNLSEFEFVAYEVVDESTLLPVEGRSGNYQGVDFYEIVGINPAELSNNYRIIVTRKADSAVVTEINYSPFTYLNSMYNNAAATQKLKDVIVSMYRYNEAAKAYQN